MKSLVGIVLGAVLAFTIGCAAKSKSAAAPMATPSAAEPQAGGAATPESEIRLLDEQISDDMAKLALTRPTPQAPVCTGSECVQSMSAAAAAATAARPTTCQPAKTQTCTDTCSLTDSICKNAGRICKLATDLGGNDAYANDKCNSGTASCEAAKQRCCSCM